MSHCRGNMKASPVQAEPTEKKQTSQLLQKTNYPNLYRHALNGNYYGEKKIKGKVTRASLKTENGSKITDRRIAEKAVLAWIEKLEGGKKAQEQTELTFAAAFSRFQETKDGNEKSTKDGYGYVLGWIKEYDKNNLLDRFIDDIKVSDLTILLNGVPKDWSASTYNRFSRIIDQVFQMANSDDTIAVNPFDKIPKEVKRKKQNRKPDEVPTIEECEKLVASIRAQKSADTRDLSADKLSFYHLAALGTAEASWLTWADIDFKNEIIHCKRKKTGAYFDVPIYPHLKEFLVCLYEKERAALAAKEDNAKIEDVVIFKVDDVKKGLVNACKRLGLPQYSPRDFRKARIVSFLRKGISVETIAKWQGHKDNGVLIRKTYAWVIDSDGGAFEQEQLKKLL